MDKLEQMSFSLSFWVWKTHCACWTSKVEKVDNCLENIVEPPIKERTNLSTKDNLMHIHSIHLDPKGVLYLLQPTVFIPKV